MTETALDMTMRKLLDQTVRAETAEAELRSRELHHFETEQENAGLRATVERWKRIAVAMSDEGNRAIAAEAEVERLCRDALAEADAYRTMFTRAETAEAERDDAMSREMMLRGDLTALADLVDDLPPSDAERALDMAVRALLAPSPAATTGEACICGYGGFHEERNPNCDLNPAPVSSGEAGTGEACPPGWMHSDCPAPVVAPSDEGSE